MCSRALALALDLALTRWSCRCRVATRTPQRCAIRTRCGSGASARVISPVSRLYLPYISPASPPYLPYTRCCSGARAGKASSARRTTSTDWCPPPCPRSSASTCSSSCAAPSTRSRSRRAATSSRGASVLYPPLISPVPPHISPLYIYVYTYLHLGHRRARPVGP